MNTTKKEATKPRNAIDRSTKRDTLELYHVVVQCIDESQQRELYERLSREGFSCRVVVL